MDPIVMEILEYLVRIVALVLSTVVMFYIRKHNLEKWVIAAVRAAEMIFEEGNMGKTKYEFVVEYMRENFKWFMFSDKELRILIEAAVEEINKTKNK